MAEDEEHYPEMLQYDWVKELPEVTKNSKHVSRVIVGGTETASIDFLMMLMRESVARPEVMAAMPAREWTSRFRGENLILSCDSMITLRTNTEIQMERHLWPKLSCGGWRMVILPE